MSKDTLIKSDDSTSRGDVESVLNKGDASGTNNPDEHFDIHKNAKKYYDIEKVPDSMPEVHKWQREHIKVHDQSKDGFPLNVILDPAMREMYQHVHAQGLTNVFDRFEQQEKIRCSFCSSGLSCQLCANGPCRISPKAPRGNCGVDADVMVSRNFVYRHVTIGTAANIFHAQQAARTLKAAAEKPESGLKIRDQQKLLKYAEMAGLNSHEDINKVAIAFADWVLADMGKPYWEEATMVKAFAPPKRQELWRKLNIFPGGGFSEIGFAQTKCMTNLNADPVDFLLTSVRLGIINEYQGLFALDILQEILMGTQKIRTAKQNMGLLKKDMINIITNGHMPLTAQVVIELASTPEWQEKAKKAGASGMQVLGHVCEGQQLLNYQGTGEMSAYGGQEGEWLSEEYLFATGAVDLFMFDYNCTIPTLPLYAERFGTKMVSTHEVIRMPGTETVEFKPEQMKQQAEKILDMALEAFAKRKAENREVYIPPHVSEGCMIGFSTESVKEALGGSWKPLIDAIAAGKIRGIATIVGCTTARYGQGGSNIFRITKGLIEKDILVLSGGCTSSVMQYTGLTNPAAAEECGPGLKEICKALGIPPVLSYGACVDIGKMTQTAKELADALDVDTNKLPLVIGAPEYLEQKAVADACTAIALGWLVHVAPVPSVTGSDVVVKVLTETTETLGLGKLTVETSADKTVQIYVDHIEKKRKELGLN
ncbi:MULTISPECIES: anaerobic carbon-monoxide dehydrogenase catalytic subunit [Sporomusa]|uniref:anaerobic carbon-monoxide dehydrogenase n=1 Tax=Sporomusa sphaeroides DSM 2875 TaxID=1337886 RepID=A0ABM9VYG7_9FIRM|nr:MULTISPECIES: anaerobic carbon-monoxide dehydrogenase catalytic subunit [Sporomusa]MCM0757837.1 anaerobic carbon-monoxide dehydrogenase catalytic subunit [Sporomusa sphaeroides DSM 2875]OLS57505.1 carbon monoxide dehydrogenase 1 [Sporomusa sphaeroides DSM 2875]CVK17931.1 Carbon monoxide dehydrogenase 1 [Sporomusa sphaeroides DSM 2875]HML34496.1 anaerobic carbon-monoxide dehydrogenase catalytic subunit [Sporomusa sphaeroides]